MQLVDVLSLLFKGSQKNNLFHNFFHLFGAVPLKKRDAGIQFNDLFTAALYNPIGLNCDLTLTFPEMPLVSSCIQLSLDMGLMSFSPSSSSLSFLGVCACADTV